MKLFSSIESRKIYTKNKNEFNHCKEEEILMRSILKGHRGICEPMNGLYSWDATTEFTVKEFDITEKDLYDAMCMRIFEVYGRYPSVDGVVTINNQVYGSVHDMMKELIDGASEFAIGDKVRLVNGHFINSKELLLGEDGIPFRIHPSNA